MMLHRIFRMSASIADWLPAWSGFNLAFHSSTTVGDFHLMAFCSGQGVGHQVQCALCDGGGRNAVLIE